MRKKATARGFTLVELVIAGFLAFLVVLALGRLILANQRSWEWGRDRAVLQQNASEALEWMARSVRAARLLEVVSATEFRVYDEAGTLEHTYRLDSEDSEPRLLEDDSQLVDRHCTHFAVLPDNDTTSVTLELELQDDAGSRVAADTRAAVRNRTLVF